jgi:hypothetical protein
MQGVHQFLTEVPLRADHFDVERANWVLAECIAALQQHGADIERHSRSGIAATAKLDALVRSGRSQYLKVVAKGAKVVFPKRSGIARAFKVKGRLRRPLDVVDTLRGIAAAAEPFREQLDEVALYSRYISRFREVADRIVDAIAERDLCKAQLSGAAAGSLAKAQEGSAIVALLDTHVKGRLRDGDPNLARWKAIMRQTRHKRYEKGAARAI